MERPELRIVPQEAWEHVKARQHENAKRAAPQSSRRGREPKYLFSGLLKCGTCGGNYIIYNSNYYGCSFHTNRGPAICANGKVVRRARLEQRLLRAIQEELFTPEAVAYLTQRVQEELKRLSRQRQDQQPGRQTLEWELAQALREREAIKDAIRRGLISAITKEMLEEVETRLQSLQAQIQAPPPSGPLVTSALSQAIQTPSSKSSTRSCGATWAAPEPFSETSWGRSSSDRLLRALWPNSVETWKASSVWKRPSPDLLVILVAGAGFEPATFGL